MGQRGPAPTPTETLKARGSRRAKERAAGGEPQLPARAPSCPAWLPPEAKAEWRRQAKLLLAMRVLTEADRAALAAYCEAWAEFVGVTQAIADLCADPAAGGEGPALGPSLGYAAAIGQGLVNAKNSAVKRLLQLAGQFGFTPAARSRVKAPPAPPPAEAQGKARFFVPPPSGN